MVQRKVETLPASEVALQLENRIQLQQSSGRPLSAATRAFFEPQFRYNLSSVFIHADPEADLLTRAINARAFTTGHHVFFRLGEYEPSNLRGRELLAHELTHVVQQSSGMQQKLKVDHSEEQYEQKADRPLERMQTISRPLVQLQAPLFVQMKAPLKKQPPEQSKELKKAGFTPLDIPPLEQRLEVQMEEINSKIQSLTNESIGFFTQRINEAAHLFKNWFKKQPRKFNTPAYIMTVAQSVIAIIGGYIGAASVITAIETGITRDARFRLTQVYNPNDSAEKAADDIENDMINLASYLAEVAYSDWGAKLKERAPTVWKLIGLEIDTTFGPPRESEAKKILYTQGGVPRPNMPYSKEILEKMIFAYLMWEKDWEIRKGSLLLSAETTRYNVMCNFSG